MPQTIDITKGVQPFDDRMDVTRNNPDRKTFGKGNGTDLFHLGSEYDVPKPVGDPPAPEPPKKEEPPPPVAAKFIHKLKNGTTIEAQTQEELAEKIEAAFNTQAPPTLEFEDKPLYQPIEFKRKELSLQEQANILNVWKENPQKALRMLEEAEYGVSMDDILRNLSQAEQRELNRRQEEAGAEFIMEVDEYNPTRANGQKLTAYLREKQKPITKQNLIVAFRQLVAAGDRSLAREVVAAPPPPPDPNIVETPPPPTIVPSNQGRPEAPPANQVDPAKFAAMSLDKQKQFFADLRRTQ